MSTEIKNGDRITFRAATRDGAPKLTRIVNGFWFGERTAECWEEVKKRNERVAAASRVIAWIKNFR